MDCSTPGFPVLHYLSEFAQIYVQWCYLTISSSATLFFAFFLSRVFSNRLTLHIRWPEYWSFSISPSNEYSGLIFFRLEWFDLLATQGTLQESSQLPNLKALILLRSASFMIQLSHPYMTTRKTIALTIWTFVGKVTSLLFNMLPRFVIVFLPRSNCNFVTTQCHCDLPETPGLWVAETDSSLEG